MEGARAGRTGRSAPHRSPAHARTDLPLRRVPPGRRWRAGTPAAGARRVRARRGRFRRDASPPRSRPPEGLIGPAAAPAAPHARRWLPLVLALLAAAYLWPQLDGGWYPHDEGQLGQAAERVLAGQLPHRDFAENYTGGLAFLHAAAFRLFGTSLLSLRYTLFAAYVAWIPLLFAVGRRAVPDGAAAALTLLAALWSVPLYPAAIPSWFNLFLATAAAAALFRWRDDRRARWLLLAGGACGLSLLAKLTGLFHLAGALLAGLVLLQEDRLAGGARGRPGATGWGVIAALLLVGAAVLRLTARSGLPVHPWLLGLPVALACAAAAWRELRCPPLAPAAHVRQLVHLVLPLGAGMAVPVALFVVPFVRAGALGDLWRGMFVLPASRLQYAAVAPDAGWLALGATVPALLVLLWRRTAAPEAARAAAAAALLAVLAVAARGSMESYRLAWSALWITGPLALAAGAWVLRPAGAVPPAPAPAGTGALAVLVPMVAFASLIQFPYMSPVYYAYTLPLGLALLAALAWQPRVARGPLPASVAAGLALFALLDVRGSDVPALGYRFEPAAYERLALPRAGLRVPAADRATYEALAAAIAAHGHTPAIWAGPDAPEVYFLSAKTNPGRTVYDFFDTPAERSAAPLRAVRLQPVDLVVVRHHPPFSDPLPAAVRDSFAARFPDSLVVGDFTVRWAR